jgi:hypothetical protein
MRCTSSSSEQSETPTSERRTRNIMFYNAYINYFIPSNRVTFDAAAPDWMNITFKHDANCLLWTFGWLSSIFYDGKYLIVPQYVWWHPLIVGLQPVLVYYIGNQRFPSVIGMHQPTPMNNPRHSRSLDSNQSDLILETAELVLSEDTEVWKESISESI